MNSIVENSSIVMLSAVLVILLVVIYLFQKKQNRVEETTGFEPVVEEKPEISKIETETLVPESESQQEEVEETLPEDEEYRENIKAEFTEEETDESPSRIKVIRDELPETPDVTPEHFIDFAGSKLLIVEDNLINQKILLNVLKQSGMEITVANNGQEALEYLHDAEHTFDYVLMDISMPVEDGYSATARIREDAKFDTMPVITFTAFTGGEEIAKMFDLGANAYITKPLNTKRLYTVFQTFSNENSTPEASEV